MLGWGRRRQCQNQPLLWTYPRCRAQVASCRTIWSRMHRRCQSSATCCPSVRLPNFLLVLRLIVRVAGLPNSASYSVFPDDYRVPFQKRRLVSIPDSLFQHYNSAFFTKRSDDCNLSPFHAAASVTTHMGLIPELERVWISIDHNLFLWDYTEG